MQIKSRNQSAICNLNSAIPPVAGVTEAVQMYDLIGLGRWFRYVTGIIEVGSAILLLVPSLAVLGAILLGCTMVGAIIVHLTVLHTPPTGPIVLLGLVSAIGWLRRSARGVKLART
jgi:putative oxidoreductase